IKFAPAQAAEGLKQEISFSAQTCYDRQLRETSDSTAARFVCSRDLAGIRGKLYNVVHVPGRSGARTIVRPHGLPDVLLSFIFSGDFLHSSVQAFVEIVPLPLAKKCFIRFHGL